MSIHRTSKSGLFLLELMIIILFFAITSAVCVRLFVSAHLVSQQNQELNQALLLTQTAAEGFKAAGGDGARLCGLLAAEALPDGSCKVYYDRDWKAVSSGEQPAYVLSVTPDGQDSRLPSALIAVHSTAEDTFIFGLEVKQFLGAQGGELE